jgi:hypothetical protein
MVAYWQMEDLTDAVSTHTLTGVGTPTFTAGKYVNALTLNGSTQYTKAADSTDWHIGTNYSISMWVKWTAFPGAGDTEVLIGQASNSGGLNRWILYAGGTQGIAVYAADTGELINFTQGDSTGWSAGTMYHIMLVKNGSSWGIYRNNTLVASTTDTSSLPDLGQELWIGAQNEDAGRSYVNGQIDEVLILKDHALTSDERAALYNSGTGAFYDTSVNNSSSST